jgi:hypothetical protein
MLLFLSFVLFLGPNFLGQTQRVRRARFIGAAPSFTLVWLYASGGLPSAPGAAPSPQKLINAHIILKLEYDVDVFGLHRFRRTPAATHFIWVNSIAAPQWVKGEFAK